MKLGQKELVGPQCWVCGVRFKCSVPPGPANKEDHHIIPRNAGGTDGPQVSLCDHHHTVTHKLAQAIQSGTPVQARLVGEAEPHQKRLAWLASVIVRAEAQVAEDPNKTFGSGIKLSPQERQMVERLQGTLKVSRNEVLTTGLKLLYKNIYGRNS